MNPKPNSANGIPGRSDERTDLAAVSTVGETETAVEVGHLLRVDAEAVLVLAELATSRYERLNARRRRH